MTTWSEDQGWGSERRTLRTRGHLHPTMGKSFESHEGKAWAGKEGTRTLTPWGCGGKETLVSMKGRWGHHFRVGTVPKTGEALSNIPEFYCSRILLILRWLWELLIDVISYYFQEVLIAPSSSPCFCTVAVTRSTTASRAQVV